MYIDIMHKAFLLILVVSGIPIALSVICGLVISILQAATSIQEQTSVYLVKFLSLVVSLFICGSWFMKMLQDFISLCILSLGKISIN